MAESGVHPGDARLAGAGNGHSRHENHVLVVAQSRINLIVVSEIVQRCGLKAQPETIEGAAGHLRATPPCLVILDGGSENHDCDAIYDDIAEVRRSSESGMPRVILLSNRNGTIESLSLPPLVDEVVAKPITLERLQQAVDRLARGKA